MSEQILPDYTRFCALFDAQQIEVTRAQYEDFLQYARLLLEWNAKMNLTAITLPEDIAVKHFLDSAMLLKLVDIPSGSVVYDIGSGAGFPSGPMKILRRDLQITLLDSLQKRIRFLETLSSDLQLQARCVHGRAEELAHRPEFRQQADVVCARAVAYLPVLAEYCLGFVKTGGSFYVMKGENAEKELADAARAVKVMGGEITDVQSYSLPGISERTLIHIRKISQTPRNYPRNKGVMTKKPL